MKRILSIIALASLFCAGAAAQSQVKVREPIHLYEGTAPGSTHLKNNELQFEAMGDYWVMNVEDPTITPYIADSRCNTGAAMLVCPGGGFTSLSYDKEGNNVAKWFAEHGITAFVLKYRLNYTYETAKEAEEALKAQFSALDAMENNRTEAAAIAGPGQRGLREMANMSDKEREEMMRQMQAQRPQGPNARELGCDDGRVAMAYIREHAAEYGIDPDKIGIIGFSAGSAVTLSVAFNHDEKSKPNLVVPVYGSTQATEPPKDATPLFVLAPEFDINPTSPTGYNLYELWVKNRLPAELQYFSGTHHGFGYKYDGEPVNIWMKLLYNFMIKNGFIKADYLE